MRRRTLLAALAGLGTLAACGSKTSDGPATVRLGLVQGQDFTHALPAQIAAAQGFFTAQRLTVRIVGFSAGSDLVKAMAGGSIDVGEATGLDVVSAAAAGVDLKAFYGTAAASPMAAIFKSGGPVHALADLKGKKVGISKFGSLTDFTVRLLAQQAGLGRDGITAVPLGAPSANTAALTRGDVDAIILPVEFSYSLQAAGTAVTAIRVSDAASQFAVLAAASSHLSRHRTEVVGLTKAYSQAITFLRGNQGATVPVAVAKLGMTQGVAVRAYQELAGDFTPDGKINTAGLRAYADQLPALGIAKTAPAEPAYYDASFT
jgi:NitT/TauT family transport system substrate-binding protein